MRIAFLIYRGNPRCGGQGVYTRHLTRELVALGHSVEVFAGPPWPDLDEGVGFTPVRGLDLYRQPDPFRVPHRSEFTSREDWTEFAIMCTAGFGEPLAYSLRARQLLAQRRDEFDVVHDNQCLGTGMLGMVEDGWPLLTTLHHPITVDRQLALSHTTNPWQRFTTRRWFGFLGMQVRVARALPAVLTVSQNSRQDIAAQMDVAPERMTVVPVGVDHTVYRPFDDVTPVPGRIMVTSSSDVPMKGLVPLLEAVAKLRTERDVELTVIGRPNEGGRVEQAIARLGLADAVHCVSGITDDELAHLYGEAQVAVVPSLYEGFSLPAIEAMSCGVAVVATTGGALPEVVGTDGETGLLVPPDDPGALAARHRPLARRPGSACPSRCRRTGAGGEPVHLAGHCRRDRGLLRGCHCRQAASGRAVGRCRRSGPDAGPGSSLMLTVDYDRLGVRPGDRVLDLGCGFGRHAFEAARRGASVVALDAGPDEVAQVRGTFAAMIEMGEIPADHPATAVQGDALRLPFDDGTFDRVIASEVLEHIPDDAAAMRELARVLRPGGSMAVTVPRCGPEVINWALSDEYHDTPGGHVRIYRRSTLERRLSSAGLEPTGHHHAHGLHSPYWWLRCLVGPSNDSHPAVEAYHKVLVWDIVKAPFVTRTADRVLSPVIGKSLVLYLTKPIARVADLPDSRPTLPRGVPGRRGPTTPSQGAAA